MNPSALPSSNTLTAKPMSKKNKAILSILYLVHILVLHNLLFHLFPSPGPGTIFTVPLSFAVAIITGILHFFLINFIKNKSIRIVGQLFSFVLLTWFYLFIYGEEPLAQIADAVYFANHQDQLRFEDIFDDNYGKYGVKCAAAFAKFKDSIPDAAFVITYCCQDEKSFYVARYGNTFVTNNKNLQLNLFADNDSVSLSEKYKGEVITITGDVKGFGKNSLWGRDNMKTTNKNSIFLNDIQLKPNEGFCTYYYHYLVEE